MKYLRPKTLLCIFMCITLGSLAQEKRIEISLPQELVKNNDILIQKSNLVYDIVEFDLVEISEQTTTTVLNRDGDSKLNTVFFHDDRIKYSKLNMYIYDANGRLIKKIKKSDFNDVSASDGFSLYNDGRYYYYDYNPISYPYTVVLERALKTENTAILPSWTPVDSYGMGVKEATFAIRSQMGAVRYNTVENNLSPFQVEKGGAKIARYEAYTLKNFSGLKREYLSPSFRKIIPSVYLTFENYKHEGYTGSAKNWDELAIWYYQNLLSNRAELSQVEKDRIHQLTDTIVDTKEKVKFIYEYMQDRTRYISVQVGIGGWMPIEATEVSNLGYGDCKGLSNYTLALLNEVGIPAYHTLIYGGSPRKDIDSNLMRLQGNHMILNVPIENEDLWLECTSQDAPFGYLGDFTSNRDVLVIYPDHAAFKRTVSYSPEESFQNTTGTIAFAEDGSMQAKLHIESSGIQYDNRSNLESESKSKQIEAIKSMWSYIPKLEVAKFDFSRDREQVLYSEDIELSSSGSAKILGQRIILPLNLFNRGGKAPRKRSERLQPFELQNGYHDVDEIKIVIPEGYQISSYPKEHLMDYDFGMYHSYVKKEGDDFFYVRELLMKEGVFSAEQFEAYTTFQKSKYRFDREKITIEKVL